jgi:hypothetical protein
VLCVALLAAPSPRLSGRGRRGLVILRSSRRKFPRDQLHDLPSPRTRREHQRLRKRRLDDVTELEIVSTLADRFPTLAVRFALVDSPIEKANAS